MFRPVGKCSDQLENVQRYFTRRVYYLCKLECKHDYPDSHLQLEILELRRLYNDVTMVYKIVHKLTSLNDDVLLSYHNANYNYHVLTRGHTLSLPCFPDFRGNGGYTSLPPGGRPSSAVLYPGPTSSSPRPPTPPFSCLSRCNRAIS